MPAADMARPASLPRSPPGIALEPALAKLADAGALVIEGMIEPDALARLSAELEPWFNDALAGEGPFFGRRTRRFSALFEKSPSTAALAIHPLVLAIAERALGVGRRCDRIQLNLTQAIGICPGEFPQAPHRDDTLFPFAHDFDLMLNAMWTLDAFTAENGATRIYPGSNLWPRELRPDPRHAIPAVAPAGSVILWVGSTLHGGGANRTPSMRRGLTFSYSLAWLAPAEKLLLSIPPHTARTLPTRLQQLIGYQVHRPNLGWVEERDPIEWLAGNVAELAAAQDHLTSDQAERIAAYARGQEMTCDG